MKLHIMDTDMEEAKQKLNGEVIRLQKYRWVILFIFCSITVISVMQFLQFTIVANVMTKYYNVSSSAVHTTGTIFFVIYILLFLPVNYLIEKYSLRVTAIVSSTLTFIGILVKVFCCDPSRFFVVLIGQGICAFGQVYVTSIPSKLSATWFGPNEVSTACAIAVMCIQVGVSIGAVFPPFLILKDDTIDDIGNSLQRMLIFNAVVAGVVLVIVILFFKAKPDYPPSKSQLKLISEYQPSLSNASRKLCRNNDFLFLLFAVGMSYGIYNSLGVVFNTIYIEYFPNGEFDLGITTILSIISGGCIGSILFGYLLDKTHQFKRLSLAVFSLACLCFVFEVYSLYVRCRTATFITLPLFEFFIAPIYIIGIEFISEVTYPVPESTSCSALNATIYVFAIGSTLAIEGLTHSVGYLLTLSVILCAFVMCALSLVFVSSNFRRTKANMLIQEINS
ncbi:unnamed protein product [Phaedon cochleariae]|uniref:Uncharacterized protein n=1 Tax=Phaedon cochleariae TaxID=80249 RepID=A0A9P0GRQ0_PHACE|nr:unnamed protein product [Phaedon cochleariae]